MQNDSKCEVSPFYHTPLRLCPRLKYHAHKTEALSVVIPDITNKFRIELDFEFRIEHDFEFRMKVNLIPDSNTVNSTAFIENITSLIYLFCMKLELNFEWNSG